METRDYHERIQETMGAMSEDEIRASYNAESKGEAILVATGKIISRPWISAEIMAMEIGDIFQVPIDELRKVRGRVSRLNAFNKLTGCRWRTITYKEKGVVFVYRVA